MMDWRKSAIPAKARFGRLALAILIGCSLRAAIAHAEDPIATIERVKRSVVAIGTYDRTRTPQFSFRGTGFVVDDGSLIITNAHVLPGPIDPNRMDVLGILIPQSAGAPPAFREAREVATEAGTDLALLKVNGSPLPALRIGNSEQVREGQSVFITGFPIGAMLGPFAATHRGMISAIAPIAIPQGRSAELDAKIIRRLSAGAFNIFQLDATAYPGSSGSPVYDVESGQVLAIINMVLVKSTKEAALSQPSGIAYAVPAKYLQELLQKAR